MGLLKELNIKGFETSYASITSLDFNKLSNRTKIGVSVYKDEATMKDNAMNYLKKFSFETIGEVNREQAYALLKSQDAFIGINEVNIFKGATDIGIDS